MKKIKIFFSLTLVLALIIPLLAQQELPCDMYVRSAKIYLSQEPPDLESALKNLEAAPEKCKKTGDIDFMLGSIYADKNLYEKMVEAFNKAKKIDPSLEAKIKKTLESKWSEVWKKGVEFLEKSDHKQALKFFEISIRIDSSRFEPYINAGYEAFALKDTGKAGILFEKAYKLVPDNMSAKVGYATVLFNRQNFKDAAVIYEEILKQTPQDKETLINLAMCYSQLGEMEKCSALYDSAIVLGLGDKDIYFNRGLLKLSKAQHITSQIAAVRDSMLAKQNSKGWVEKLNKLITDQKKFFEQTEPDFLKVVAIDSTDQEGWYHLGFIQYQLEKNKEAKVALENSVKLAPQNQDGWGLLSLVYTKLGMKKEAEAAAQKAKTP